MFRILALAVLPVAFLAGCAPAPQEINDQDLQKQMAARGWARDTRMLERAEVTPFAMPAKPIDEIVARTAVAWSVSPRKLKKAIRSEFGLEPARLDMLSAAASSSGVPVRNLVSAMVITSKTASMHGLAFPHHLAVVSTLAMSDPEPYRISDNFNLAVEGVVSAEIPGADPSMALSDRILVLDYWRRSHEPGFARDGCLEDIIKDTSQRHAVSLLLQDYYMLVFCDLMGQFECSRGQAWRHAILYPLPDGVQKEETWRMIGVSQRVLMWVVR